MIKKLLLMVAISLMPNLYSMEQTSGMLARQGVREQSQASHIKQVPVKVVSIVRWPDKSKRQPTQYEFYPLTIAPITPVTVEIKSFTELLAAANQPEISNRMVNKRKPGSSDIGSDTDDLIKWLLQNNKGCEEGVPPFIPSKKSK